jgi:methylenetetrahydrofolate dehydrogenase (NADP+)/methenyltetrahydrofolate cyclohydrolase
MTTTVIDGRRVSTRLLDRTREVVSHIARSGPAPCLATILVGDDPASHTYVRMKANRCRQIGMRSRRIELDEATTTEALVAVIRGLSTDDSVHGILVQHPMPSHIDERAAFDAIAPAKDVDGVTAASFADCALGRPGFVSCTPGGILRLLDAYDIPLAGRHAVVVGRSEILGLPMGMLLLRRNATVTYCHSHTTDLPDQVRAADVLVAAVGRPELIKGEWIRPGSVVIDAGYNPGDVGDVEFGVASERAAAITPVPGGVGPMTIAVLLAQTAIAAQRIAVPRG